MRKNGAPYEEKSAKQQVNFNEYLQFKKRKKGFYHYKPFKKDMTYILGARCKDGVVLVGDTKITAGGGTDYTYEKKITFPLSNIVMASAGIGGLSREFQNRVITAVIRMEKERIEEGQKKYFPPITTEQEFSVLVSKVIRDMHDDYGEDSYLIHSNLMILCALRIGSPISQLTTFTGYGFPEPVNDIRAIGHGEPYGSVFIKKVWNNNMSMEQVARLGLFIIKFIDDNELDSSVGFKKECLPQVVIIPDAKIPERFLTSESITTLDEWEKRQEEVKPYLEKYPIQELTPDATNHMLNEISSKISDFNNIFFSGQFKL